MSSIPLYVILVNYNKINSTLSVIENYIDSEKPVADTKLIILDNGEISLDDFLDFASYPDIIYLKRPIKNKASAINFILSETILEDEALMVCIDNDIEFKYDFLSKYYERAIDKGQNYFFGTSIVVEKLGHIVESLVPYLQNSQVGRGDQEFLKMNNLIFFGCSYAFFKSQWLFVGGFDERFSAGSKYGLGADESIFQKKLKYVGFNPFFIEKNEVIHKPELASYKIKNIKKRQFNNGFTHGFQTLIVNNTTKRKYSKRSFYLIKRSLILLFKGKVTEALFKFNYVLGFLKAYLLYLTIENKESYLTGLKMKA